MILGFSGLIASGKDAAARRLIQRGAIQVNFSFALKAEILRIMPRTVSAILRLNRWPMPQDAEMMRRAVYEEKPPGIRELLQEWGTDLRRTEDPDYWIKRWSEVAGHLLINDRPATIVTTDVRFPNEAQAIKDCGGLVVRIHRPGQVAGSHISEHALDAWPFDAAIDNDGSLEDLWDEVDRLTI